MPRPLRNYRHPPPPVFFFPGRDPCPPLPCKEGDYPPWIQYQKVCFAWSVRCEGGMTSPLRHKGQGVSSSEKGEGYPPSLKKKIAPTPPSVRCVVPDPTPLVDQKWGGWGSHAKRGIPTRIQQRGCITVFWCTTYGSLNRILWGTAPKMADPDSKKKS